MLRLLFFFLFFSISFEFVHAQCSSGFTEMIIEIVPDSYPAEISWEVTTAGTVVASGTFEGDSICVDTTLCTTFTIHDTYGDGICCGYGTGYYNIMLNGNIVATGGEYDYSESTSFYCPVGSSCGNPIAIAEGTYSAAILPETWYEWSLRSF